VEHLEKCKKDGMNSIKKKRGGQLVEKK